MPIAKTAATVADARPKRLGVQMSGTSERVGDFAFRQSDIP